MTAAPTDRLTVAQLRSLAQLATRPLSGVRDVDVDLYEALATRIATRRREAVREAADEASAELRGVLDELEYRPGHDDDLTLPELVLEGLADRDLTDDIAAEAAELLTEWEPDADLDDTAASDRPLAEHPLLVGELQRAWVAAIALGAGLRPAKVERVLERLPAPSEVTDGALRDLVTDAVVSSGQADALGLTATLYHLTGESVEVAEALRRSLATSGIRDVRSLAALDAADWQAAIHRGKVPLPDGTTSDELADQLERTVTRAYPTDALLARLTRTPAFRLLSGVRQANPGTELLTLDYAPDSSDVAGLRLEGLGDDERHTVLDALKTHQRIFALTDDIPDTARLIAAGYPGALEVATAPLTTFRDRSGLPTGRADRYHQSARRILAQAATTVIGIQDLIRGGFDDLAVANTPPDIRDFLQKIPGYAALFGAQDYCECEHCSSILGPAAYFVDLMSFVDDNIRTPFFSGDNAGHALDLQSRRPDLWTLELTCENIDTVGRHLDLVNEVLESYLAARTGYAGSLDNRIAVTTHVYGRLATDVRSFQQPFSIALAELAAYLGHLGHERADAADVLSVPPHIRQAAQLGLSRREHRLITHPRPEPGFLQSVYHIHFDLDAAGVAAPVRMTTLHRYTGLGRDTLGELIATRFVTQDGAEPVQIVGAKRTPASVQNDVEEVHGLRLGSLDRLHRLARLTRVLPWSIPEVDLALTQLGIVRGGDGELDEQMLSSLTQVLAVHRRFARPVEQTCALWGPIPRIALSATSRSLFDRLFNKRILAATQGTFPKPNTPFIHPWLRSTATASPADNTAQRLQAALGVSDADLATLIEGLARALGARLRAPQARDRGFELTIENLTLLYRHAQLASLLGLPVADLFVLMSLAGLPGGHVTDLTSLTRLFEFADWRNTTGYSLRDLQLITGRLAPGATGYPDPRTVATTLVERARAAGELEFADTLFAFLPGVTEADSRAVVAANAAAFEKVPPVGPTGAPQEGAKMRLADDFDPRAPLVVPPGVDAGEDALRELLLTHHASRIVPARLGALLGLPDAGADKVTVLIALTGRSPGAPDVVAALRGGPLAALETLVAAVLPLSVLYRAAAFDAAALEFVRAHPAVFGIDDPAHPDVPDVRALSIYRRFATDPSSTEDGAADLREVLRTFDPRRGFAGTGRTSLAAVLDATPAFLASLLPHLRLPRRAAVALDALGRAVTLATDLGVDGEILALIVSEGEDELRRAATGMRAALLARYPDEKAQTPALEPIDNVLAVQRRNALVDHLIRAVRPGFATQDEVSQYLLVDCATDGCARTSRLVFGISAVQRYVHRILMNLEQDRRDPADPEHVAVTLPPEVAAQWRWRQHYRYWEANRKVFLWPENYLEPALRDDKTPLSEELESTLLGQTVDEQAGLDAYGRYLTGLDEVANLQLAGAYHERNAKTRSDVLHLIGVTPTEPPTHYYRAITNARYGQTEADRGITYGPWRKIDVSLPVRKVAPVVYLKRLFLLWTELVTAPRNSVSGGSSEFAGYRHRMTLKYTMLRLDGTWTAPQPLTLHGGPFDRGDGVVSDPLTDKAERTSLAEARGRLRLARRSGHTPGERRRAAADVRLALAATRTPRYDDEVHSEARDGYTLTGFQWDRVYPRVRDGKLWVTGRNFRMRGSVDFYRQRLVSADSLRNVHTGPSPVLAIRRVRSVAEREDERVRVYRLRLTATYPDRYLLDDAAFTAILADERRIRQLHGTYRSRDLADDVEDTMHRWDLLGEVPPSTDITVVNGSFADAVLDVDGDLLYLQSTRPGLYVARRLSTTLAGPMRQALFAGGVVGLLALQTQDELVEQRLPIAIDGPVDLSKIQRHLDFRRAFGTYFREVFFHIPFLVASHLNAAQQFEEAQGWYHFLFDPTATEIVEPRPGENAAQLARRRRDRVWRYREFRGRGVPSLRSILTDPQAIAAYQNDPFNPWAIARLRLSASQKAVVMRYVDNLLDWGDNLFSAFTTESVNEATTIYLTAADVLGPRPEPVGSCAARPGKPPTYHAVREQATGSEFLLEVENLVWVRTGAGAGPAARKAVHSLDRELVRDLADRARERSLPARPTPAPAPPGDPGSDGARAPVGPPVVLRRGAPFPDSPSPPPDRLDPQRTRLDDLLDVGAAAFVDGPNGRTTSLTGRRATKAVTSPILRDFALVPEFAYSLVRQLGPVFCVPPNPELRGYWDRIEDRLYKLRHCFDIKGVRRQLELFAPEIDPRLLVRAAALGLSLEDVVGATSGDLPPYRFTYLVEKARQHATLVQSFGSALLATLEKKDAEELARLRAGHQHNLLTLTTRVREWEVRVAEDTAATVARQIEAAEYRRDYYAGLLEDDLLPNERLQQASRHVATAYGIAGTALGSAAATARIIAQLGSPFALTYGGEELGTALKYWSEVVQGESKIAELVSASAGLEAGFDRRREGWRLQRRLAQHELRQLERQASIAELRRQIAERGLRRHGEEVAQAEEILRYYGDKFSGLGLYTRLSSSLQRLHREAYDAALATARLAEQAYRFERDDQSTPLLLRGGYFDVSQAGLLAGEQLLIDIEQLERRFIETNYRTPEIDQAFSLTQIAPGALVRLRAEGECTFTIPEVFFDLFYPGQYRRRIRAVRLTIPCVTGPYANVPATLELKGSRLRRAPQRASGQLVEVPLRRSTTIATSTAQNDAGVFEYSFREERYLPFEGAGAVSDWRLTLPKTFRPFDYQTITDVIVHISYTADSDEELRREVEQDNATLEGSILEQLAREPLPHVYSLRHDFSTALNQLLHSPAGTAVKIAFTDRHLPIFLRGRPLSVQTARLVLRTPHGQSVTGAAFEVDGVPVDSFTVDVDLGRLWSAELPGAFAVGLLGEHTLRATASGDLAPDEPEPGDTSALDEQKLPDLLLLLDLGMAR